MLDIHINKYRIRRISEHSMQLDHPSGYSQYPIRYDDGRIAYDWPEIVPKYIKKAIEKAFNG